MAQKFKEGDKVNIPTTKSTGDSYESFKEFMARRAKDVEYLLVEKYLCTTPDIVSLKLPNRADLPYSLFLESDLSLYEEERTIYRFKTEKELRKDYGGEGYIKVPAGWCTGMDKFFGQEVSKEFYDSLQSVPWLESEEHDRWSISKEMLTTEKVKKEKMGEQKVIVGWKTLKELPGVSVGTSLEKHGSIWQLGGVPYSEDYLGKWPDFFEPVYEERFKVGDVVTDKYGAIGAISSIRENMVYVKEYRDVTFGEEQSWFRLNSPEAEIYRKATKEETEAWRKSRAIEFRGYPAQVEDGKIAYGCQKFTLDELKAYKRLYSRRVGGYIMIGDVTVEGKVLDALIARLQNM